MRLIVRPDKRKALQMGFVTDEKHSKNFISFAEKTLICAGEKGIRFGTSLSTPEVLHTRILQDCLGKNTVERKIEGLYCFSAKSGISVTEIVSTHNHKKTGALTPVFSTMLVKLLTK